VLLSKQGLITLRVLLVSGDKQRVPWGQHLLMASTGTPCGCRPTCSCALVFLPCGRDELVASSLSAAKQWGSTVGWVCVAGGGRGKGVTESSRCELLIYVKVCTWC
jgi:hypothetical protein